MCRRCCYCWLGGCDGYRVEQERQASCPRLSFSTWRCSQGGPARWGERLVVVVGVVLVRAAGLGLASADWPSGVRVSRLPSSGRVVVLS